MFFGKKMLKQQQQQQQKLIEDFSRISDWFVNDKLSIHCGDDKTKSILFDLIS